MISATYIHAFCFEAKHTYPLIPIDLLAAGEELTISYVDVRVGRAQRRAALKLNYGFDCGCSKCTADLAAGEGGGRL